MMNTKLQLTSLFVVVVVVGGSFRGSSAEKLNSLKLSQESAFEKRGNRDRRDLANLFKQIDDATYVSTLDETCPTTSCQDKVNKEWCSAFCASNKTAYGRIAKALIDCYMADGLCKKNFTNFNLTNVNISIGVDNYNGQCYLYGQQVQMTLADHSNNIYSLSTSPPSYYINVGLDYVFQGLTLVCRPSLPNPTGNNREDKISTRKFESVETSTTFQIPLTISQREDFSIFMLYQKNSIGDQRLSGSTVYTSVTFDSSLPPALNEDDVTNGIKTGFQTYDIFYRLQFNFYNVISNMLRSLVFVNGNQVGYCPPC